MFHIALVLQLVVGGVEISPVQEVPKAVVIIATCNSSTCDVTWKGIDVTIDWGDVLSQILNRDDVIAAHRKDDRTILVMRKKKGAKTDLEAEWKSVLGGVREALLPYLAPTGVLLIQTRRQTLLGSANNPVLSGLP